MADGATSPSHPTSEELHRGLGYLREDIQDLRNQVGSLHRRIDETNGRIDETNGRIDETNRSLGEQIRAVHKAMESNFRWTLTTLVALTGILIGVIKL
ncbi:MAG: hypothetical protein OXG13_02750 [Gemmatimonadaceae bacterium]|nr:hypothetical protein [Gemmatimonadaceae bacterium]